MLKSVHRIEPIPFKGCHGLYHPPARVVRRVTKLLASSTEAGTTHSDPADTRSPDAEKRSGVMSKGTTEIGQKLTHVDVQIGSLKEFSDLIVL